MINENVYLPKNQFLNLVEAENKMKEYQEVLRFIQNKLGNLFEEVPIYGGEAVQILNKPLNTRDVEEMFRKVNKVLEEI